MRDGVCVDIDECSTKASCHAAATCSKTMKVLLVLAWQALLEMVSTVNTSINVSKILMTVTSMQTVRTVATLNASMSTNVPMTSSTTVMPMHLARITMALLNV